MGSATSRSKAARKGAPVVIKRGSASVSIYEQRRVVNGTAYRQHVAVWFRPDGKRERKAFANPEDAKRHAETVAAALSRGDAAAAGFTGSDAAIYAAACERLSEFGVSLSEAVAEYQTARRKLPAGVSIVKAADDFARRNPSGVSKRVSEVLAEFVLDRRQSGVSSVHLADIEGRLGRFAEDFQMPIAEVTAPSVTEWLRGLGNSRTGQGSLSSRSRNNYLRLVGSLFHYARKQRWVSRDLAEEIAEIDIGRNAPAETGVFSPEQMAALLAHCPPDLVAPLAIGAFAGVRLAELARLDWKAVDLRAGFVRIEAGQAKTASRRLIPISDNLRDWLAPLVKSEGPISPREGTSNLNHAFVRGPARAGGVPWVRNGLRHSFISYRLALIGSAPQVALEAGNSPAMVFKHYRELVSPAEAAAWFSIRRGGAQ